MTRGALFKLNSQAKASLELKNWLVGQGFKFDDWIFGWNDNLRGGTMVLGRHGSSVLDISFKKTWRGQFKLRRDGRRFTPEDLNQALNTTAHGND